MAEKTNYEVAVELKANAVALAAQYNEQSAKAKFAEANKTKAELNDTVNEYTGIARTLAFNEIAATEDPMQEACKRLFYDSIRVKETPIEGSILTTLSIEDTQRPIDLRKLDKHCKGIGADEKWKYAVEKFNQLMTARQAKRLGINPVEVFNSYYMNSLAKDIDLGKDVYSDKKVHETIDMIIEMMLGEGYTARDRDVKGFIDTYAKLNKKRALTVTCSNHRQITELMQRMCYAAITGDSWDVEYKKAK